jgi:hypothetical protein
VFGMATMHYRSWAHVEHGAFWVGLLIGAVGFLRLSRGAVPPAVQATATK